MLAGRRRRRTARSSSRCTPARSIRGRSRRSRSTRGCRASTYPSGDSSFTLSDAPAAPITTATRARSPSPPPPSSRGSSTRERSRSEQLTEMYLERLDDDRPQAQRGRHADARPRAAQAQARGRRARGRQIARAAARASRTARRTCSRPRGSRRRGACSRSRSRYFDYDATVIAAARRRRARCCCAKLSLGELAMGDVWFGGQTRTPWDPKKGSGGSSAGPAAAVAGGLVAFAIGSETMGSIVSPVHDQRRRRPAPDVRPRQPLRRDAAVAHDGQARPDVPRRRGLRDGPGRDRRRGRSRPDRRRAASAFAGTRRVDVKKLRIGYDVAVFEALRQIEEHAEARRLRAGAVTLRRHRRRRARARPPAGSEAVRRHRGHDHRRRVGEQLHRAGAQRQGPRARPAARRRAGRTRSASARSIPASDYLRAMQVRTELMRAYPRSDEGRRPVRDDPVRRPDGLHDQHDRPPDAGHAAAACSTAGRR